MATASLTIQRVYSESKDGKAFLRRVIRDCLSYSDEQWAVCADESTGWKLKFYRTVRGNVGDPDAVVEVQTDIEVGYPSSSRFGMVKTFHDSSEVEVPRIRRLYVRGSDAAVIAALVLNGSTLHMEASAGSTSSSHLGLAFYRLTASVKGVPHSAVAVGTDTVCRDGKPIIQGAIAVD